MDTDTKLSPGEIALLADLARADKMREFDAYRNFLKRGCDAWRHPASTYDPTASGLRAALVDELRRMGEEAGRG